MSARRVPTQRGRSPELRSQPPLRQQSLHAGRDGIRVLRTILAERLRPVSSALVKSAGRPPTVLLFRRSAWSSALTPRTAGSSSKKRFTLSSNRKCGPSRSSSSSTTTRTPLPGGSRSSQRHRAPQPLSQRPLRRPEHGSRRGDWRCHCVPGRRRSSVAGVVGPHGRGLRRSGGAERRGRRQTPMDRDPPGVDVRSFWWVVGCSYEGLPERGGPVRNPIGANMALRRAPVQAVGGFSPDLGQIGRTPLGCEETEVCIRLTQRHPSGRHLYAPERGRSPRDRRAHAMELLRPTLLHGRLVQATVSRMVGRGDGLASERSYALGTLPQAAVGSVRRAWRTHQLAPAAEAGVIAVGLVTVTAGFAIGSLVRPRGTVRAGRPKSPMSGPSPAHVLDLDLDLGLDPPPLRRRPPTVGSTGAWWTGPIRRPACYSHLFRSGSRRQRRWNRPSGSSPTVAGRCL